MAATPPDRRYNRLTIILTILGIVVPVVAGFVIYWLQTTRKEVSYEIRSQTPLVNIQDSLGGRLQILFDGVPVEDVDLTVLRILNSGNVSIEREDYEVPISFSFGPDAEILSAEVTHKVPRDRQAVATIVGRTVVLSPTLLNAGDMVELTIITSRSSGAVDVSARISGVSEIRQVAVSEDNYILWSFGTRTLISFFVLTTIVDVVSTISSIGGTKTSAKLLLERVLVGFFITLSLVTVLYLQMRGILE